MQKYTKKNIYNKSISKLIQGLKSLLIQPESIHCRGIIHNIYTSRINVKYSLFFPHKLDLIEANQVQFLVVVVIVKEDSNRIQINLIHFVI